MAKKLTFWMELRLLIARWGNNSGFSGWVECNYKVLTTVKDRQKKRIRERDMKTEGMSE